MNVTITKVYRDVFKDSNGKEIMYCKVECLVPNGQNKDNIVGYDLETYSVDYKLIETFVNLLKAGKQVAVSYDFVLYDRKKQLYKKKLSQVNDLVL